jgi:hypothetical protein
MTNDEIIQIARRAYKSCEHIPNVKIPPEFIERFAKLVAQHEREACAKIVEVEAMQYAEPVWAFEIVNDIRERL